jgi:hypothetical protein
VEGTPFGRYRLVSLLGRGGMGGVWRAYDTGTDRTVALKVLPARFAKDPTYEERFRREAQAAARVHNPHIVPRQRACAIGAQVLSDTPHRNSGRLGQASAQKSPPSPLAEGSPWSRPASSCSSSPSSSPSRPLRPHSAWRLIGLRRQPVSPRRRCGCRSATPSNALRAGRSGLPCQLRGTTGSRARRPARPVRPRQ